MKCLSRYIQFPLFVFLVTFICACQFQNDNSSSDRVVRFVDSDGGILEARDGSWKLMIPEGALDEETMIAVTKGATPVGETPEEYQSLGEALQFEPAGLTFNTPATLQFYYPQSSMPEDGIEERIIGYYYINDDSTEEEAISGLDVNDNIVTAQIPHFSYLRALNMNIDKVNDGTITDKTKIEKITKRIVTVIKKIEDVEEQSRFYQDNSELLDPFTKTSTEILGEDVVTGSFPEADFDNDGRPNEEDPINGPTIVTTPTFDPEEGTYTTDQTIAISTTTADAEIYYTLDGTVPDRSATLYFSPISVAGHGTNTTIKAIAFAEELEDSVVASAEYQIRYPAVADPVFSPAAGTYDSDQNIAITCETSDSTIYYTTDGSDPTTGSTEYSTSISIAGHGTDTTIKAIAVKDGLADSEIKSAEYTINYDQVSTPAFSPAAGNYNSTQTVTISSATVGATIYYTTNGTTPTTSSTQGTTVSVTSSQTIKALAVLTGKLDSEIGTAAYVIETVAPSPGDSGTISYSDVTRNTLTLSWTGATDAITADSDLQYRVYQSTNSAMDSVSDVEANGTALGDYTANSTGRSVTGLTPDTTYYFNVIVRDEAGNKAVYGKLEKTITLGAKLIYDVSNISNVYNAVDLTVFDGKLYFCARDSTHGYELWVYDGTNDPTIAFDLNGSSSSSISSGPGLIVYGGKFYFVANDGENGKELWSYDGINAPEMVIDLVPGSSGFEATEIYAYNDKIYLASLTEMYVYDLSTSTASLIYENQASNLKGFDNKLYFAAVDSSNDEELWCYDGSTSSLVYGFYADGNGQPADFTEYQGELYMSAIDENGRGLWKYSGTGNPTRVSVASSLTNVGGLTVVNNNLFFRAYDGTHGMEPWKYDGSDVQMGADIYLGNTTSSVPDYFCEFDDKLYFQAADYDGSTKHGKELWAWDGTNDPYLAADIWPGGYSSSPSYLTEFKGKLYFQAQKDTSVGYELHMFDGNTYQ